jgi:hypothetical protein
MTSRQDAAMNDRPEPLEELLARDLDAWRAAKAAIEKARLSSRAADGGNATNSRVVDEVAGRQGHHSPWRG